MKLVIISHTPHYRCGGEVVGWGPTVREISQLSEMFDRVVHVAPMHSTDAPESALPYESQRIEVREVVPSGGEGLKKKLRVLSQVSSYARVIRHELRDADAVHVRCPANISLVALIVLMLMRQPRRRWLKYAGNWCPSTREPWSYSLQRWMLKTGWHKGVVTVNGDWPNQPTFVRSFLNPCLSEQELLKARQISEAKLITKPVRLIFVGRVDSGKGVDRTLQIVAHLNKDRGAVLLDVVGDGHERLQFERQAQNLGIDDVVTFHGWLPRAAIAPLYARAHLVILPSASSEGWPKVLSEAMAYGVVPIASDVSSIPQYLDRFGSGKALTTDNLSAFVEAIHWYSTHAEAWKQQSENATKAAELFSYALHCTAVRQILQVPLSGAVARAVTSEAFQS